MSILTRTGQVCKRTANHLSGRAAGNSSGTPESDPSSNWPEPLPLDLELPPVADLDLDLLPSSLRPQVEDVSERMQVPADYPAAAQVCTLAGAVNRRASIQPLANDPSWEVIPNLWGALIGPPGVMKSALIENATRPLNEIQSHWFSEYDSERGEYERSNQDFEVKHSAWRDDSIHTFKKKGRLSTKRRPDPPERPVCRRLIVNDATPEKLQEILSENPLGILITRDEYVGWLSTLDRDGREGERDFALQCWNGTGSFTVDRIGRGTIQVEACCTSMLGGIQPLRLQTYLLDPRGGRRPENDGLLQRFQVSVWPDLPNDFKLIDRAPDDKAQEQVSKVLQALVDLPPDVFTYTKFDGEAQGLFNGWRIELEKRVRAGDHHPALTSHLSKYRSLMPSLALLFFLADLMAGERLGTEIGVTYAQKAAGWCTYLTSHAERIYSCVSDSSFVSASILAKKIEQENIGSVFSLRDVYAKGWAGLRTVEQALSAVKLLIERFWVRELEPRISSKGGRPSTKYEVNPRIWNKQEVL